MTLDDCIILFAINSWSYQVVTRMETYSQKTTMQNCIVLGFKRSAFLLKIEDEL